jgi:hypothetical protein
MELDTEMPLLTSQASTVVELTWQCIHCQDFMLAVFNCVDSFCPQM